MPFEDAYIPAFSTKEYTCYKLNKSKLKKTTVMKYNNSDKIIMPYTALGELSYVEQEIYTLELSNPSNGLRVFVGVLNFTAPHQKIFVPPWVMTFLGISSGNKINADILTVTPATSVTIKCPEFVDDPVAILEYLLTRRTILYTGLQITDTIFDKTIVFTITELKPCDPALITNNDVKLNIIT